MRSACWAEWGRRWLGLVALSSPCLVGLSKADSVSLTPVADTTLLESAPDANMGGWTHVVAGSNGNLNDRMRNRALFRFDVASAVPAGATITNAVLTLIVTRVPGTEGGGAHANSIFGLHRLLVAWGEGNKLGNRGFPADRGEATWNMRFNGTAAWSQPGAAAPADFVAAESATNYLQGLGSYAFGSTSQLVSDVQLWLDQPTNNFGWLVSSEAELTPKTARGIGSREDTNNPPVLRLDYSTPGAPLLQSPAVRDGRMTFQFTAQAGSSFAVEITSALPASTWSTLTNFPPLAAGTNVVVWDAIASPQRFYRLRTP